MNNILYSRRCRCKEEFSVTKRTTRSKERPILYGQWEKSLTESNWIPTTDNLISKIFQVKYEKKLSSTAKLILNNIQKKYIYYAIDDILYLSKLNSLERENLLEILYTPVLSLQNNFSINFFNIWIGEIYINEISKANKFLNIDFQTSEQFSYITIKLLYRTSVPVKKPEPLW